MGKYKAWYGLSGGFGGAKNYEIIETETAQEANDYAWELACQEYDHYVGSYGLRDYDQIADEEGLDSEADEEEINEMYNEEREGWLDYWVDECKKEEK
jgi:hypothetical protein